MPARKTSCNQGERVRAEASPSVRIRKVSSQHNAQPPCPGRIESFIIDQLRVIPGTQGRVQVCSRQFQCSIFGLARFGARTCSIDHSAEIPRRRNTEHKWDAAQDRTGLGNGLDMRSLEHCLSDIMRNVGEASQPDHLKDTIESSAVAQGPGL
uniref:Uncharacterized protein n=1 Tax=Anopheles merus TaxID=30066 RepID=A0A182UX24_ANOME